MPHSLCPFAGCRFINGDDATRNLMLKLIPHIADGSWVVRQSVGTTPVITGKVRGGEGGAGNAQLLCGAGYCLAHGQGSG